jgi:hypothetical protein
MNCNWCGNDDESGRQNDKWFGECHKGPGSHDGFECFVSVFLNVYTKNRRGEWLSDESVQVCLLLRRIIVQCCRCENLAIRCHLIFDSRAMWR